MLFNNCEIGICKDNSEVPLSCSTKKESQSKAYNGQLSQTRVATFSGKGISEIWQLTADSWQLVKSQIRSFDVKTYIIYIIIKLT